MKDFQKNAYKKFKDSRHSDTMNDVTFGAIANALEGFPELLSSNHLVELGLYSSVDATYQARLKGCGPEYIKLRRKILYPKKSVMDFLVKRMQLGADSL